MDEHEFPKKTRRKSNPYPGASAFAPYPEEQRKLKHSGPGIASFVIGVVTLAGYIVTFIVAGAMVGPAMNETSMLNGQSGGAFLFLGMAVLALAALNFIGVVVGIIGLALRGRRKVFGVIGTIINGIILLVFLLLIAVVLMSAGALQ